MVAIIVKTKCRLSKSDLFGFFLSNIINCTVLKLCFLLTIIFSRWKLYQGTFQYKSLTIFYVSHINNAMMFKSGDLTMSLVDDNGR